MVLTTQKKDRIADTLAQWVESISHHYEKRVHIVPRDGRSEFTRTKLYCEQHNIRRGISAPDTPLQNGVSEAGNKVILRLERSMLIEARMPVIFGPWAVKHVCFIVSKLYCLRTKKC